MPGSLWCLCAPRPICRQCKRECEQVQGITPQRSKPVAMHVSPRTLRSRMCASMQIDRGYLEGPPPHFGNASSQLSSARVCGGGGKSVALPPRGQLCGAQLEASPGKGRRGKFKGLLVLCAGSVQSSLQYYHLDNKSVK